MNNNQLNIYEKQRFKVTVLNSASNPIPNLSKYTFTWKVTDSLGKEFTDFKANKTTMTID